MQVPVHSNAAKIKIKIKMKVKIKLKINIKMKIKMNNVLLELARLTILGACDPYLPVY